MKMVEDWKDAWRWFSVHCMVIAGAVQGAWVFIPIDMRESLPRGLVEVLTMGLLALGVAGRLVQQKGRNAARERSSRE